jgi:hypothetical protein
MTHSAVCTSDELSFANLPSGDGPTTTGSAVDNTEHHFTRKERDTQSGNDYSRARYYAMRWRSLLLFLALSVTSRAASPSDAIPPLHGQSFADTTVNLPADLNGRPGILVLGFSKKSSAQTKTWNDVVLPDYGSNPHIVYYESAVLADVPSFIRGTILKSIRNSMSPAERAHFVPILTDSGKWRSAAQYSAADDAYVLLVDPTGQIQWRTHGPFNASTYATLKESLAKLGTH